MVRKVGWVLVIVGYAGLVWYGVTGETGPMGWLNALQQQWTGGYSRKLSFLVLCFGGTALGSPILIPLLLAGRRKIASVAPAPTVFAAISSAPAVQPRPAWVTGALAWAVPVALAWIGTLGYCTWDWRVRVQDTAASYRTVSLAADAPVVPVTAGNHLALRGRFLWDRAVVRRERSNAQSDSTFVAVVDTHWRDGEPVRFVAQFGSRDLSAWHARENSGRDPILARVNGTVPTVAFDVFAKAGAMLAPSAALIVAVAAADGQPAQGEPAFDVENALVVGTVLTAVWTLSLLAIVLAMAKERWHKRRRDSGRARGAGREAVK